MNLCGEPLCGPLWTHKTLGSQDCFFKVFFKMFFFKMPHPRREGNTQKNIDFFLRRASFLWISVILCGGPVACCCCGRGVRTILKKTILRPKGPVGPQRHTQRSTTEDHRGPQERSSPRRTTRSFCLRGPFPAGVRHLENSHRKTFSKNKS